EAEEMLFTGGLRIYSTIDIDLQKELEDVYKNFEEVLIGNSANIRGPALINWRLNNSGNIIDENGKIVYYRSNNIINDDNDLIVDNGTYEFTDNENLLIKNNKFTIYPKHVEVSNYYRIDDRKNLVTHTMGSLSISEDEFSEGEDNELIISKEFLDKIDDFYTIDDNNNLIINKDYFYRSTEGIVQPQSASVVLDYRSGHIKAIVGGRDVNVKGNRILNRATNSPRQPGSVIKPISVYLPALDNGYTAASPIKDEPFKPDSWNPRNWYSGHRGIQSLRRSVEQSINTNSAKTLEDIGIQTSMAYLEKMGIIDKENSEKDNFITKEENTNHNDENIIYLY